MFSFLVRHNDFFLAVAGVAFLSLGVVSFMLDRVRVLGLRWLGIAAFGLLLGLDFVSCWLLLGSHGSASRLLHVFLFSAGCLALLDTAWRVLFLGVGIRDLRLRFLFALPAVAFLACAGAGLDGLLFGAAWLLCLPSSVCSAAGLWLVARRSPRKIPYVEGLVAFASLSLFVATCLPAGVWPPALVPASQVEMALGLPMSLVQAAIGWVLSVTALSTLIRARRLAAEKEAEWMPPTRLPHWLFPGLLVTLALGLTACEVAAQVAERDLRQRVIETAQTAALAARDQILSIGPDAASADDPRYLSLKSTLAAIARVNPDLRFVWAAILNDEQVIFLADSEAPDSPDCSPPGQVYVEADPEVRAAFLPGAVPAVIGPQLDRWGSWVSAVVPVGGENGGAAKAVLAVDISIEHWLSRLMYAQRGWTAVATLLGVLLMLFGVSSYRWQELRAGVAASEQRYRNLVDSAPACVMLLDGSGKVLTVSERGAQLLATDQGQLAGRPFLDIWPFAWRPVALDALERVTLGDRAEFEAEYRGPDGSERFLYVVLMPSIRDPLTARRCVAFAIDITQRRRAEEELRRLEAEMQHAQKLESLGLLAGGIAHDFNNLLVGIMGHAELAAEEMGAGSPQAESLRQIQAAAERAAALTGQMLAYSGKGRFQIEEINLGDLGLSIAGLLDVSISKRVRLIKRVRANAPNIEGDAAQVQQVIMNLITNASEAIGDQDGTIRLTIGGIQMDDEALARTLVHDAADAGLFAFIEVTDDGCGMDAEVACRIFDPFFSTKFTGRGLGMAAVLGIVRGHRGAIEMQTEQGKGTRVRVLFPAVSPGTCPAQPALVSDELRRRTPAKEGMGTSRAAQPAPNGDAPLILVVDDEDQVLRMTVRMLESGGFRTITAVDGREAVETVERRGVDISAVVLDLTMPRLGGEEAFREMQLLRPDIRVVLTSGYSEFELAERLAGSGVCGFLQKPFRRAAILAVVQQAISVEADAGRAGVEGFATEAPVQL